MLGNFLLGACAFATALAAQRVIAPFSGLGLTLHVAVLSASLLGFSLGCILSASIRPVERLSPLGGRVLLGAAVWTLALIALRRPLLESLDHTELRLAVMAASVLFAGLPCAGIGFVFAEGQSDARGADAMRGLSWLLLGAGCAAPLSGYLLVPRFGLTVTLTVIAAIEALVALVSGARRASLPSTVGALLVLTAAAGLAVRPAGRRVRVSRLRPRRCALPDRRRQHPRRHRHAERRRRAARSLSARAAQAHPPRPRLHAGSGPARGHAAAVVRALGLARARGGAR
jgi:hypothetical protein